MAKLNESEEKELMKGIEQMLREMLVPELQAIRQQIDALSASIERQLAIIDRAPGRSRGIPFGPWDSTKKHG